MQVDTGSGESRTVFILVSPDAAPQIMWVSEARVWDAEKFVENLARRYPACTVSEISAERAAEIRGAQAVTPVEAPPSWEHQCPKRPPSAPRTVLPSGEACDRCGAEHG